MKYISIKQSFNAVYIWNWLSISNPFTVMTKTLTSIKLWGTVLHRKWRHCCIWGSPICLCVCRFLQNRHHLACFCVAQPLTYYSFTWRCLFSFLLLLHLSWVLHIALSINTVVCCSEAEQSKPVYLLVVVLFFLTGNAAWTWTNM